MTLIKNQNLKRSSFDARDYSLFKSKKFGSVFDNLKAMPKEGLGRRPQWVKDQGDTNYCTAYGVSSASEYQEGIELSPEYQAAREGQLAGSPIVNGCDMRTALSSAVKFGALPSPAPLRFPDTEGEHDGWIKPALPQSFPSALDSQAEPHKKGSYYAVTFGGREDLDAFDSARVALWFGHPTNAVIIAGGFWFNEFNYPQKSGLVGNPTKPITRHCYLIIAWKIIEGIEVIGIQSPQGKDHGDGGLIWLTREQFNYAWKNPLYNGLCMYLFHDKEENLIPIGSTYGLKNVIDWVGMVFEYIKQLINAYYG